MCGVPLTDVPLLLLPMPLLLPDAFWRQAGTGLAFAALGFVMVVGEAEPMPAVDCSVGCTGNCEELPLLAEPADDEGEAA